MFSDSKVVSDMSSDSEGHQTESNLWYIIGFIVQYALFPLRVRLPNMHRSERPWYVYWLCLTKSRFNICFLKRHSNFGLLWKWNHLTPVKIIAYVDFITYFWDQTIKIFSHFIPNLLIMCSLIPSDCSFFFVWFYN